MRTAFNMKDSMPYYVHIIWAHLPDLLKEYGSLLPFSNQGFENCHQTHDRLWRNLVSKGGRSKTDSERTTPTCQLMQVCLRRILLTIKLPGVVWGQKYMYPDIERKRRYKKEKKREQSTNEDGCVVIRLDYWEHANSTLVRLLLLVTFLHLRPCMRSLFNDRK